jgi:glutathione S-transferase
MSRGYVLFGGAGTGAVAIEAALRVMGEAYDLVDLPDRKAVEGAAPTAPMRQVPALTFPNSETLTESAAILTRLAELDPGARLAPGVDDPQRGAYLRWMSFVSSAIYAHYWVKDEPSRLVADPAAHGEIDRRLDARISECWRVMGAQTVPAASDSTRRRRRAWRPWSSAWTPTPASRRCGPTAIRSSTDGKTRRPIERAHAAAPERHRPGLTPMARLNARLNAASLS